MSTETLREFADRAVELLGDVRDFRRVLQESADLNAVEVDSVLGNVDGWLVNVKDALVYCSRRLDAGEWLEDGDTEEKDR
jgi:hypothetical protein